MKRTTLVVRNALTADNEAEGLRQDIYNQVKKTVKKYRDYRIPVELFENVCVINGCSKHMDYPDNICLHFPCAFTKLYEQENKPIYLQIQDGVEKEEKDLFFSRFKKALESGVLKIQDNKDMKLLKEFNIYMRTEGVNPKHLPRLKKAVTDHIIDTEYKHGGIK